MACKYPFREGGAERARLPRSAGFELSLILAVVSSCLPHALQFLDSNLPPDSIHFGRDGSGVRSAICRDISHGNRTSAALQATPPR